MRKIAWAAVVVILATATTVGQNAADGEIEGRIGDLEAYPLPGVRLTLTSSNGERRQVVTDSEGRFILRLLRLEPYNLVAELPGFITKTGSIVLSPRTRRAHVEWRLDVGCVQEVQRVMFSAREAARMVDAIVHVRIESDHGELLFYGRPECDGGVMRDYSVRIINAVPGRSGTDNREATLQILRLADEERLEPGREYLALLWRPQGLNHFWNAVGTVWFFPSCLAA